MELYSHIYKEDNIIINSLISDIHNILVRCFKFFVYLNPNNKLNYNFNEILLL